MTNITVNVVGLGYVGLPLYAKLTEAGNITAYGTDVNPSVIDMIRDGHDPTGTLDGHLTGPTQRRMAERVSVLPHDNADAYIICVPTPDVDGVPDYSYVKEAGEDVGRRLRNGSIVILESTVAPGTTNGLFREAIESTSDGKFFHLAYSPERINPYPNAYHSYFDDTKIVGCDDTGRAIAEYIYQSVFKEVEFVGSPETAELAKCFENTLRSVNIAMMNMLSLAATHNGIPLRMLTKALQTKPAPGHLVSGFVGGHCIPVDPFYTASWMDETGLKPFGDVIRKMQSINKGYTSAVIEMIKELAESYPSGASIMVLGETYKPDVPDLRNSGAHLLYNRLYAELPESKVYMIDPIMDIRRCSPDINETMDIVVAAVAHSDFLDDTYMERSFKVGEQSILVDVGKFPESFHRKFRKVIQL